MFMNQTGHNIYLDADGNVVDHDNPKRATLLVADGSTIAPDQARRYGLHTVLTDVANATFINTATNEEFVHRDGRAVAAYMLPPEPVNRIVTPAPTVLSGNKMIDGPDGSQVIVAANIPEPVVGKVAARAERGRQVAKAGAKVGVGKLAADLNEAKLATDAAAAKVTEEQAEAARLAEAERSRAAQEAEAGAARQREADAARAAQQKTAPTPTPAPARPTPATPQNEAPRA